MTEPSTMELVVGAGGEVRCTYDEALDLREIGTLKITRASHIELLARAVVLVAGMDLPDADRAAVLARVRVAAGKEAPSPGLDQAETLNLISRLTE